MRRALVVGFLGLVALAPACGGDDEDASTPCTELFGEGTETPDLDDQPQCVDDDGARQHVASSRWTCEDGGELFANAYGYGVKGEPWRTDGIDGDYARDSALGMAITECMGDAGS